MLRCAERDLDLTHPQIMGVLNITPDSFSDAGQFLQDDRVRLDAVMGEARRMVHAGAAVLDVGGESTRPGATPVSEQQELARVIPVVQALQGLDVVVSVDTRHAAVAAAAITAGAHMINDVTAGRDPRMLALVAEAGVGFALMHMQGSPATMQQEPHYNDVVADVRAFLQRRAETCYAAGIPADRLLLDPGFGFGKTVTHNLQLLASLRCLRHDGLPLLVGLSRKSTIGAVTGRAVHEREFGSVAAAVIAAERGANLIRVHDVAATMDGLKMWRAVADQEQGQS